MHQALCCDLNIKKAQALEGFTTCGGVLILGFSHLLLLCSMFYLLVRNSYIILFNSHNSLGSFVLFIFLLYLSFPVIFIFILPVDNRTIGSGGKEGAQKSRRSTQSP